MEQHTLNAKITNGLVCALSSKEFNRVWNYENAKNVCGTLEVTHEGTNWVKDVELNILTHQYELLEMKSDESTTDIYTHSTNIINGFKFPGKTSSKADLVNKFLRSLPKSWKPKVIAIQ